MGKLTHNLGAKIGAIFLFVILTGIGCCCVVGLIVCDQEGYDHGGMTFYDTHACANTTQSYFQEIAWAAARGELDQTWLDDFTQWTNITVEALAMLDGEGNPIALDYPAPSELAERLSKSTSDVSDAKISLDLDVTDVAAESDTTASWIDVIFSPVRSVGALDGAGGTFYCQSSNGSAVLSVRRPLQSMDEYYFNLQVFTWIYPLRNVFLPVLILVFLLLILLLCFLLTASGHRKDCLEPVLNHQDHIPLDLYLLGVILAVCFLFELLVGVLDRLFSQVTYVNGVDGASQLLLVFAILVCSLLVLLPLAFLMTFATRMKVGKWWRNTVLFGILWLIGRFFRGCGRFLRDIRDALGLGVRVPLLLIALLVIEFLLVISTGNGSGFALFLLFCLNLALVVASCFLGAALQKLRKAGQRLASGEVDYQVDTRRMVRPLAQHGQNLNAIGQGMTIAVEQRMKSERLKAELITNVSHDIKTPLTSIVNYVDLLQKKHTPQQEQEYLSVLARQSQRLKKLTEDLVEASKASTGNIQVELVPTNVNEILNQAAAEYGERLRSGRLDLIVSLPEPPVTILADGRLLWRAVDNLLSNVVKYGLAGTRVYLDATVRGDQVLISVKNISRDSLNVSADELMERFVRGDSSRNTEGSGLGLNIAKSLTELQQGRLTLSIDGDLFKAELSFPLLWQPRPES